MAIVLVLLFNLLKFGFDIFKARKYVSTVILILVVIGGLVWLLLAAGYDLITMLFDGGTISMLTYIVLGAADLYLAAKIYRGYRSRKRLTLTSLLMALLAVSGICWLIMAFRYNPVTSLAGAGTLATIIYLILGLVSIFWPILLSRPAHKKYW